MELEPTSFHRRLRDTLREQKPGLFKWYGSDTYETERLDRLRLELLRSSHELAHHRLFTLDEGTYRITADAPQDHSVAGLGKIGRLSPVGAGRPRKDLMKLTATLLVLALAAACSKSGDPPKPSIGTKSDTKSPAVHIPPPGTFRVDATHSTVLFKVRHLDAGYIYGWFKDFSGTFTIDADPTKSHIELAVKTASLDTRDDERNGHITGPDFLNAKQSPELTFKSTSVDAGWHITGDLTIRGVTKSVTFTATPVGDAKDPRGQRIVGLEARFTIARGDFGVSFMPEMVGPEIEVIIALEGAAV